MHNNDVYFSRVFDFPLLNSIKTSKISESIKAFNLIFYRPNKILMINNLLQNKINKIKRLENKIKMNSKYKIMKYHGFNPFRSNQSRELSELISKDNIELQKLKAHSKLNMKQIALILQNHQENVNANRQPQNQQGRSLVTKNYELHQQTHTYGEHQRNSIVMFNERQFCKKTFDQVFTSQSLNQRSNNFYEKILSLEREKESKQNSQLIIYLANSRQESQKVILGHNQTQSDSQGQNPPQSLLQAVYQRMVQEKTPNNQQKPSSIYFSAIGIEKENNLYDILNQQHINNDGLLSLGKVPQVKIRKILKEHDSIIAQNLKKQPIKDKHHLNQLIQKSKQVRNLIEFYDNFNQTFFLGELYHFYEANADYDLFNECVVLKIYQHFPKLSSETLEEGFYQRRVTESNTSRIATLMMRIGLNIKACRKNKLHKQASILIPKKMSQLQMHQSKILLYLAPIFMNLNTHYILVNEVGSGSTISDEIKKFELNRGFRPDKNIGNLKLATFYHTKHYLDNKQVQQIVQKSAIKYVSRNQKKQKTQFPVTINNSRSRFSQNSGRQRQSHQIQVRQQEQANEQDKYMQSLNYKKFSHTQTNRTFQTDAKRRKSMLKQGQRVKSKSFFCQTISSSERNYWKSVDRRKKKNSQALVDIGKLLYDEEKKDAETLMKSGKTINSRVDGLQFVDQRSLVKKSLQGVRVTYKRKLVVKALSKPETALTIG